MTRLRVADPSAARTRARWAFWTLIGVNAVMLWFFVGMAGSLAAHARVLDERTLQRCASAALQNLSAPGFARDLRAARFVGDATVRFAGEVERYDERRADVIEFECTVRLDEDSDQVVVLRAAVVG